MLGYDTMKRHMIPQTPNYGLVTTRQAARLLQVTPRTVERWCREGRLRAIKIGRVWRVRTWDGQPIIEVDQDGV